MVIEVQVVDYNSFPKHMELKHVCDMLHYYSIEQKEWKKNL